MSELVDSFREVEGAHPRVVATLEALDHELAYVRDDVEGEYDRHDLDRAYRAMMSNQVSADEFAAVGTFGDLDCQALIFDDILVFLFPSSRYEGIFVSFDRTNPFPFLDVAEMADTVSHLLGSPSD